MVEEEAIAMAGSRARSGLRENDGRQIEIATILRLQWTVERRVAGVFVLLIAFFTAGDFRDRFEVGRRRWLGADADHVLRVNSLGAI